MPASPPRRFRCTDGDDDDPGEGDEHAYDDRPREAVVEHDAGDAGHEDRRDVHQQGRGAGVQVPFGPVEHHRVPPRTTARRSRARTPGRGRAETVAGTASATSPSEAEPTSSRAKAIAPGESTSPTERITTKAQAQSSTVISAAAAARCLLDMSATMPRLRRKHNR